MLKKQYEIMIDNQCGCIVDEAELVSAILWKTKKPVASIKRVFVHSRYPAISIYGKKHHVHRLLMSYWQGRNLKRREYVHHKDGNRFNALWKNLELIDEKEHQSFHNIGRLFSLSHRRKTAEANRKRKGIKIKKTVDVPMDELHKLLSAEHSINYCAKYFGCDWSTIKRRIYENPELLSKHEALRQDLGTYDINTTPDELQRLREEG